MKILNKKFIRSFYQNYQLEFRVTILGIFLIILIIIAKVMFIHDDFYYPFKNTITSFETIFSLTDKGKAAVHLKNTQDLYNDFMRIRNRNPQDERLLVVAREMGFEEALAMRHMDRAKKQGVNIKDQVEKLCDTLELQQKQLRFIVMIAKPEMQADLQEALNITDQDLAKAMDW